MLPEIRKFSIPIYVSDDSPNHETKDMIVELHKKYKYIFYKKNMPSLGHDKNLMKSIKLPDTDYVWLLGDSIAIEKGAISKILKTINRNRSDIIAINARGRDIDFPSGGYCNHNDVLSKFGWHLTLTGATLYSKKAVQLARELNFSSYRNFPQFSLIYHYLAEKCSFCWTNDKLIYSNKNKKSYWANNVFSVFIDDWSDAVNHLPISYNRKVQNGVIVDHSIKSNIFNIKTMLYFRGLGYYNWEEHKKYAHILSLHSGLSRVTLFIIALFPIWIVSIARKIK